MQLVSGGREVVGGEDLACGKALAFPPEGTEGLGGGRDCLCTKDR